jgi:hypothetical protein
MTAMMLLGYDTKATIDFFMMKTLVKYLESLKLKSVIWKMYLSVRILLSKQE